MAQVLMRIVHDIHTICRCLACQASDLQSHHGMRTHLCLYISSCACLAACVARCVLLRGACLSFAFSEVASEEQKQNRSEHILRCCHCLFHSPSITALWHQCQTLQELLFSTSDISLSPFFFRALQCHRHRSNLNRVHRAQFQPLRDWLPTHVKIKPERTNNNECLYLTCGKYIKCDMCICV